MQSMLERFEQAKTKGNETLGKTAAAKEKGNKGEAQGVAHLVLMTADLVSMTDCNTLQHTATHCNIHTPVIGIISPLKTCITGRWSQQTSATEVTSCLAISAVSCFHLVMLLKNARCVLSMWMVQSSLY